MKVIADLCVVPIGVGISLSNYIVECEKILIEAGFEPHLHAYGTNIEGEWEDVFSALRGCHEHLHAMGVPRISTTIRLGTRTDRVQSIKEKVDSVRLKLTDS